MLELKAVWNSDDVGARWMIWIGFGEVLGREVRCGKKVDSVAVRSAEGLRM